MNNLSTIYKISPLILAGIIVFLVTSASPFSAHACPCTDPCTRCSPDYAIPQWWGETCDPGLTRQHTVNAFDADKVIDDTWFDNVIDQGIKVDSCNPYAGDAQVDEPWTTERKPGERQDLREWLVETFFEYFLNPAMMRMTQQMVSTMMAHASIVGTFFDAKHQLETQTLFDSLYVKAIEDYQPSEPLCRFGTLSRSLAASEQKTDVNHMILSEFAQKRQLSYADGKNRVTDLDGRARQFARIFCDPDHAGGHLVGRDPGQDPGTTMCYGAGGRPDRYNRDINYTKAVENELSLDINLTDAQLDPGEGDVMAMAANLFGHEMPQPLSVEVLRKQEHFPLYMNVRSALAKRNVAENSFFAIASMKSKGTGSNMEFLKNMLGEFGYNEENIEKTIGENPSYHAQMELLTKKLYQNPNFYNGLIDTPANIDRQDAAIMSFELMQQRDFFESMLRQEMVLSVVLEELMRDRVTQLTDDLPR